MFGAGLACLLLTALAGSAIAQGVVRDTVGDWQVRCDQPPGAAQEQCALMQSVTAEDRQNVGLTVVVLKTADNADHIMRVQAPLGVLLPAGLGLRVDDEDVGRALFVRCVLDGCIAEIYLKTEELAKLQAGSVATFIIFQTPEEGIGIPVSLAGFTEGYAQLQ
ncbi:MAG: invasion associated locus B family protein [Pseudomonadota bacterium]